MVVMMAKGQEGDGPCGRLQYTLLDHAPASQPDEQDIPINPLLSIEPH
jgi:hypothetical protein